MCGNWELLKQINKEAGSKKISQLKRQQTHTVILKKGYECDNV